MATATLTELRNLTVPTIPGEKPRETSREEAVEALSEIFESTLDVLLTRAYSDEREPQSRIGSIRASVIRTVDSRHPEFVFSEGGRHFAGSIINPGLTNGRHYRSITHNILVRYNDGNHVGDRANANHRFSIIAGVTGEPWTVPDDSWTETLGNYYEVELEPAPVASIAKTFEEGWSPRLGDVISVRGGEEHSVTRTYGQPDDMGFDAIGHGTVSDTEVRRGDAVLVRRPMVDVEPTTYNDGWRPAMGDIVAHRDYPSVERIVNGLFGGSDDWGINMVPLEGFGNLYSSGAVTRGDVYLVRRPGSANVAVEPELTAIEPRMVSVEDVEDWTYGYAAHEDGEVALNGEAKPGELYVLRADHTTWIAECILRDGNVFEFLATARFRYDRPESDYWIAPRRYSHNRSAQWALMKRRTVGEQMTTETAATIIEGFRREQEVIDEQWKQLNDDLCEMADDNDWCSEFESAMERVGMEGRQKRTYDITVEADVVLRDSSPSSEMDEHLEVVYGVAMSTSYVEVNAKITVTINGVEGSDEEDAASNLDSSQIESAVDDVLSAASVYSVSDWTVESTTPSTSS